MRSTVPASARTSISTKSLTKSCIRTRASRLPTPVKAQLLPDLHIDAVSAAYVGLGSAAAAFVGTFFVIPQFKDQFKEDINWKDIHKELVKQGVKTVTPKAALEKSKRGAVLLDVRMRMRYESADKAAGSVNIQLYQPIQNWDLASNLRRAGFAFFGIYGTELSEKFLPEVLSEIPTSKEVIVMCDIGGTINTKVGAPNGFQSRSLKALYFLQQNGYKKLYHLEGGLSQWFREGLPAEETDEDEDATSAVFNFAELVSSKSRK